MPHDLPKAYDPGAIESRWAEYWVREKLFHVPTPESPKAGRGGDGEKMPAAESRQETFTVTLPPPNVTGNLHM